MALVAPPPKDSSDQSKKKPSTSSVPSHTVRTSSTDQKLDKHRYHQQSSHVTARKSEKSSSKLSPLASIVFPRQIKLTSIERLRQSIDEQADEQLLSIVRHFVYVGTIDGQTSLIQHETQLYLVHTRHLSQELFYQLALYHFGNFGTIRLESESPSIEVSLTAIDERIFDQLFRNYFDWKRATTK